MKDHRLFIAEDILSFRCDLVPHLLDELNDLGLRVGVFARAVTDGI